MKPIRLAIGIAALSIVLAGTARSQFGQSSLLSGASDKTTVTNFYFARPNDLTIVVNVLGYVQKPGRYEIASSIDLLSLIALAGGPTADGTLDKVMVTRLVRDTSMAARGVSGSSDPSGLVARSSREAPDSVRGIGATLRKANPNPPMRWKTLDFDLSGTKVYDAADLQMYSDDVVTVGKSNKAGFRDFFDVVSPILFVTNVILQILILSRQR